MVTHFNPWDTVPLNYLSWFTVDAGPGNADGKLLNLPVHAPTEK
jgi:hypothetical protein